MSKAFLDVIKARRSYYALTNKSPISNDKILEIVKDCVNYTPMAFNMQTSRTFVALQESHVKAWDIIGSIWLPVLPQEIQETMKSKIELYKAGYGSVFIFEDQKTLDQACQATPQYAEGFKLWSRDSSGMLQGNLWNALEAEGFGANLQHHAMYSPDIPKALSKEFGIPEEWNCTSILVFGEPAGEPGPKSFLPIEERVKVSA